MKFKVLLIAAGLGMSLLGLTSCGQVDGCTYQYPETSVLFDDFHITKTIYSQGTMRLYYRGVQFKDNPAATTRILRIWAISLTIRSETVF